MEGLLQKLPPLAPDYSGVSGVFFSLGGVIILNGADGCIGNVTGYDEPRFFDHPPYIYSTGLREVQAITGDEETLRKKIDSVLGDREIPFVVILGTPNSAIIASDHVGVSKILRRDTEIPVFPMNTSGIVSYEHGASQAFLELAKAFSAPTEHIGGVHIVGAAPLDYWDGRQVDEMKNALENQGLEVTGVWGMDNSLTTIEKSPGAEVNLVVSFSGLQAARYMRQEWDIPYVVGVPAGKKQTQRLALELRGHADERMVDTEKANGNGRTALIIGDQVWTSSIREYLCVEKNFSLARSVSLFSLDREILTDDDYHADSEEELTEMIHSFRPDVIIGDPLFRSFVSDNRTSFIGVPHLAVSSRIHWDHDVVYAGERLSF